MEGFIYLHRKLLENPICQKPAYLSLWIILLLKASYAEKEMIWDGGIIKLEAGQFITGRKKLSMETGIPESTIERALDYMEKSGQQIKQQKNNRFRIITIVNWSKYQKNGQQMDTKTDSKRTTDGQLADTINKDNKDNKNKVVGQADNDISGKLLNSLIRKYHDIVKAQKGYEAKTTAGDIKNLKSFLKESSEEETTAIFNWYVNSEKFKEFPNLSSAISAHSVNLFRGQKNRTW